MIKHDKYLLWKLSVFWGLNQVRWNAANQTKWVHLDNCVCARLQQHNEQCTTFVDAEILPALIGGVLEFRCGKESHMVWAEVSVARGDAAGVNVDVWYCVYGLPGWYWILTVIWTPLLPDSQIQVNWPELNSYCSCVLWTVVCCPNPNIFFMIQENFPSSSRKGFENTDSLIVCPGNLEYWIFWFRVFPHRDGPSQNNNSLSQPKSITDTFCLLLLTPIISFLASNAINALLVSKRALPFFNDHFASRQVNE